MEEKTKEITVYLQIVKRGHWWMLRDATGSFWGVYGSWGMAKLAIPLMEKRWGDVLKERGKIKLKVSSEPRKRFNR